ncbi:MAG: ATP-binding protein, partial [Dehalococcoidales bacterium]|nr:ATP-binding protein [Dehalococcoidales bacterium]
MSIEEIDVESFIDDDDELTGEAMSSRQEKRHEKIEKKNQSSITRFLGKGKKVHNVGIMKRYYGELLVWALQRYLEKEQWQIDKTIGYHERAPIYLDIHTDYATSENLMVDGQLLLRRGEERLIATVDTATPFRKLIMVEGLARHENQANAFIEGVLEFAKEQNFYRGKKIEFTSRIRFLDVQEKTWESVILDASIKEEIKANTVGFLQQSEKWKRFGIPLKRGILLSGEPGTGKTIICKSLMTEGDSITCISTSGYDLAEDDYITQLYEMAQDLSPCIVFIEDIDLIAQNRMEFGFMRGPALLSLLAVMDGVEEQREIVTVATTNCLELLDKAVSERPSRFDRVIKLTRPGLEHRRELVRNICRKIPLSEAAQHYLAAKTEDYSPAQIQEIIFSLVIQHPDEQAEIDVTHDEIDRLIARINGKSRQS